MNIDTTLPEGWLYTKAKTALVRAAALIMQERGPRAATLKNISRLAGVTEPAIFRHFDGVDGMFEGLFAAAEFFYDLLNRSYSNSGVKGLDRFEQAYTRILDLMVKYKDFTYLVVFGPTVFQEYEELYIRAKALKNRDKNQVISCFKEAAKSGQLRKDVDPETMALAVLGQTTVLYTAWIECECGFNLKDRGLKLWKDTVKLFGKGK